MPKVAALCRPVLLAELESICGAILKQLQASPSEYDYPAKPESLRNEVTRRARVIGAEEGLDLNQIKRAVIRSFKRAASPQ
jgi:hypothetical protein